MNDQFPTPHNGYTESDARKEVAAAQSTPEHERTYEPYRFLMAIPDAIESFRGSEIMIEQKRGYHHRKIVILGIPISIKMPYARHPEKILEVLTDAEWAIGGELNEKKDENGNIIEKERVGYRFGLSPKRKAPNQADWYHETPNPHDSKNPYVVHFEVTPTELQMLLTDGNSYTPTVQDLERFVHGVYHYLYNVRKLYPLDATIDDLLQEIAADIPDDLSELVPQHHAGISRDQYKLAA